MYDPPHTLSPIVASLTAPDGGVWLLGEDGAIYAYEGAAHKGAANGQAFFAGRRAARLDRCGAGYRIVATSGERYDFP